MKAKKITYNDFINALKKLDAKLSQIQKFSKISATAEVVKLVDKLAFNDQRKLLWVNCDGTRTRTEIENNTGVSHPTTVDFIDECIKLGLVEEEKQKGGHPKRIIDYVPDEWKRINSSRAIKEKRIIEEVSEE